MKTLINKNRWLNQAAFLTMLYPSVVVFFILETNIYTASLITLVFVLHILDFMSTIKVINKEKGLVRKIVYSSLILVGLSILAAITPEKDNGKAGVLLFFYFPALFLIYRHIIKSRPFLRAISNYGNINLDTINSENYRNFLRKASYVLSNACLLVAILSVIAAFLYDNNKLLFITVLSLGYYRYMFFYLYARYPNKTKI